MQVVETTDVEESETLLSQAYTSLRIRTDGPASFRSESVRLGAARLDRVRFDMGAELTSAPLDLFVAGHVTRGRQEYRHRDTEVRYGPGDVFLAPLPGTAFSAQVDDLDKELFSLDSTLLAEVASPAAGDAGTIRFLSCQPVSPQAARTWRRTFAAVRDETACGRLHDLAARRAARVLALATLRTFPSTAQLEPAATDRRDAHPETLRRAVAYIEAHPSDDLTIADVAEATHVSVRAVQLAFRQHLGLTPMAYHRRVRLAHARDDLLATGDMIGDVAARWGFFNPGRFATAYRREYGELPRETLGDRPART